MKKGVHKWIDENDYKDTIRECYYRMLLLNNTNMFVCNDYFTNNNVLVDQRWEQALKAQVQQME